MRENRGALFISGYIFLIMTVAFSLLIGLGISADGVATAACFTLVVGVVLQIFVIKNTQKKLSYFSFLLMLKELIRVEQYG